ncbi:hypothetical protein RJ641_018872 [Dillenia turbinata]|uniref:Uncharacterized protein n=1 Tax=Dillenia turbinata TaxID=194707 RepID=A0AAN8UQD1_9MAGN
MSPQFPLLGRQHERSVPIPPHLPSIELPKYPIVSASDLTQEQKAKMLVFAKRLAWKMRKQDEPVVENFCAKIKVEPRVLKVRINNNKRALGNKP